MALHTQELLLRCWALPAWEPRADNVLEVLLADKLFWHPLQSLEDTEQLSLLSAIKSR